MVTFPGSYHAGFSTGLNIGEAVNFVNQSWIKYGYECLQIYRNSREKVPVFPIDWIILENIRVIDSLQLCEDSKSALGSHYLKVLKEEISSRKKLEQEVHFNQEMIADRENAMEDDFPCQFCIDLNYNSFIHCREHNYIYCISHLNYCGCSF